MKEEIRKYIENLVGEKFNKDFESTIVEDVVNIVNKYTEFMHKVTCNYNGRLLQVDVFYKENKDEDFKILNYCLTPYD